MELSGHLEQLFWLADSDKRGYVTLKRLYKILTDHGLELTFQQFRKRFSDFDTSGDIQISLDGYLRVMGCPAEHWQRYALYKMMFRKYDKSDSGSVTKLQLSTELRQIDPSFTDRELDLLFKMIDLNQSGRIEFDDFIRFFFNVDVPSKYE